MQREDRSPRSPRRRPEGTRSKRACTACRALSEGTPVVHQAVVPVRWDVHSASITVAVAALDHVEERSVRDDAAAAG
jgi:hypothetical protein